MGEGTLRSKLASLRAIVVSFVLAKQSQWEHPPQNNSRDKQQGIVLILMLFLMIMCSLIAITALSLYGSGVETSVDFSNTIQAFSIASGGKEWYLEQLQNDNNWADQANLSGIALGAGTFNVTINSASASSISFTVTGQMTGLSGQGIRRQVSMTAKRLPAASLFALYWGRDTGATLNLNNSTVVSGNFWSAGTTSVNNGCSVSGASYCPLTEDILGAGSYSKFKIPSPYPVMPQINTAFYGNFISASNTNIATHGTGLDGTINTNMNLTGGFYGYRNLTTTGNISITGYGYLVATQGIDLHATAAASGTLTITPSGGNIYILAGRNLTVNSTAADTNVIINGDANNRVYLYSQDSSNTRLVRIRKNAATTTNINSTVIIGGRRIIVESGAQIRNSTLYVADVTDTNNYLQITGSGTAVGISGSPCAVLSVSGRTPGLIIDSSASVTGLVYHFGGTTGTTQLATGANIRGSVVASQFASNIIANSTIIYSEADLPPVPNGFESFVSPLITSWDDR